MRHQAPKGFCSIFVGIPEQQKGYLVYVPSTRKVISSYDVVFDEGVLGALAYTSRPYSEEMVMRQAVTYTPFSTSSKEQTGDVITFTQFEEGKIFTKTRNDVESGDKSDNESIMMSEQDMENLDSSDELDHDLISTEMLHDIFDGSQTHPNVNKREARYKIRDRIKKRQPEWKGALKATQSMGKGLHMVFSTVVKYFFAGIDTFGRIWFRSFPFHSRT